MVVLDTILLADGVKSLADLGAWAGKKMLSKCASNKIPDFVAHAGARATERGFTPENIARVLKEGKPTQAMGRYGPQTRYTLGNNTVVVQTGGRNAGKIVTVFSDQTVNGVKGGWVQ
jgi:hypothetical protein